VPGGAQEAITLRGRDIAIAGAVLLLLILILSLLAGTGLMPSGMMDRWGWENGEHAGFNPWWGVVMMLLMALFWLLVIGGVALIVVWAVRQGRSTPAGPGRSVDRSLEILRERYARGEISYEEYDKMRRNLEER
jgi:putative membrane protein